MAGPGSTGSASSHVTCGSGGGSVMTDDAEVECRFCRRTNRAPNPFRQGPLASYEHLPFRLPRKECLPCRNYCNLSGVRDRAQLARSLSDHARFTEYKEGLANYERLYNATRSEGGRGTRVTKSQIEPVTAVTVTKTVQYKMTEQLGIFWPLSLYTDSIPHRTAQRALTQYLI